MTESYLQKAIAEYDADFIDRWRRLFGEHRACENENRMWLAGPTSYIFNFGGEKFAVDPQVRRPKDRDLLYPSIAEDMSAVRFVLITHDHGDHMCPSLMKALKDLPIIWYLPKNARRDYIEDSEIPEEKIVYVSAGDVFDIGKLKIKAYHTPHGKPGGIFPDQCGYEIIAPNGTVFIPGDVRDYDYRGYDGLGKIDLCISHLWAGNDSINETEYAPLMEEYADFTADIKARRYFLCHLYEIGRKELNLWHDGHAERATRLLKARLPDAEICVPRVGESYSLDFENS